MERRGQKRAEMGNNLPTEKRACSSSESIPSPTIVPRASDATLDCNMASTSSASPSSRSEHDSCDDYSETEDEDDLHQNNYPHSGMRTNLSAEKYKVLIPNLSADAGPSAQLAALTELCSVLSMTESLSGFPFDTLVPFLVSLANHESNPEIMLLAIRSLTYLCDFGTRSSSNIVKNGGVSVLCAKLMSIEYMDVAEQCLQALEKISRDHPVPCLQAGVVMAALTYIDFFSLSIQRVALVTVVNICKKLPQDCSALIVEAIPTLSNLLHNDDTKLVESVTICLRGIADYLSNSSEMLDEFCKHGVVHQSVHLIAQSSQKILSRTTRTDVLGLLARLTSGSSVTVRTLFDLNISRTLAELLTTSDLSHGKPYYVVDHAHSSQVHEVLRLLNHIVHAISVDNVTNQVMPDKDKIMWARPDQLEQFGLHILPVLIQVVESGASLYIYYSCLSVINKVVYFSPSDMLLRLLKNANISSFLAGVLAQKDPHLLFVALKIVEMLLLRLPNAFLNSLMKEGVVYAIVSLSKNCPSQIHQSRYLENQTTTRAPLKCLCYALDSGLVPPSSEGIATCQLGKDTVVNLAEQIKATYFIKEQSITDLGLTNNLQNLKIFCSVLNDNVNVSPVNEEYLSHILNEIAEHLIGGDPISTFEFNESGLVRSLAHYLSNGQYLPRNFDGQESSSNLFVVKKRVETFANIFMSREAQNKDDSLLLWLVRKLQNALASLDQFPVILSHELKARNDYIDFPTRRLTVGPCLKVKFMREEEDMSLSDYSAHVLKVDPFISLDVVEEFLWQKVTKNITEHDGLSVNHSTTAERDNASDGINGLNITQAEVEVSGTEQSGIKFPEEKNAGLNNSPRLFFFFEGKQIDHSLSLYQAILQQMWNVKSDMSVGQNFWKKTYEVTYRKATNQKRGAPPYRRDLELSLGQNNLATSLLTFPFFSSLLNAQLPGNLEKSNPTYDTLFLLNILEGLNRVVFHLISNEKFDAFADGSIYDFDDLRVTVSSIPQTEFLSSKLSEKLEQQLQDPLVSSIGAVPSWFTHLMAACPFLFSFEVRHKFFRLSAFGSLHVKPYFAQYGAINNEQPHTHAVARKKFTVSRKHILDSAAQMMSLHDLNKTILEVEYDEEVGTGLGPTMEFYTLVSHEFWKSGLGMWREDHSSSVEQQFEFVDNSGSVLAPLGLFPRPWSTSSVSSLEGMQFSEVIKKFQLLGQLVGKAFQDGRVMDLHFSKAFYKLILEQELSIYDIQLFDPQLGKMLLEFQALVRRKKFLESDNGTNATCISDLCFRNTKIEDLFLDFSLPGYPDFILASGTHSSMVNIFNLEEYVSLIVDASLKSGIYRQLEAFRSGLNQVFPLKTLKIFNEDEFDQLLCGEQDNWHTVDLQEQLKFDHGYTASSPAVINLLEIIQEFTCHQRRAFLQFVTGAPRLPPGGLAALTPQMTIVRKHCGEYSDGELPSVMTCANYLKLPSYSSKEVMRERLLYAITEGQGSFHLS
ncbi:E3 ubiquitin-protein ligase UPL4 [Acorus calamus]|uniref:HECT-type E3 ubiquitin transferase n=1 Tax=Acorus calamus TaxID=4465 RepID=A0AAV9EH51_ACOCL|nr:E3 ubiquitin-protein ligase UPL4 [Acorus calamus]